MVDRGTTPTASEQTALSVLNGPFGSLVSTARQLVVVDVYSRV